MRKLNILTFKILETANISR